MSEKEISSIQGEGKEYIVSRGFGILAERMGIECLEYTAERIVARMPVEGNTQPVMIMHGGAYVVLGESLGSSHANYLAPEGHIAVGVDINATHTASASEGYVVAECVPVHTGRSLAVHEIVIRRESDGKRCSTVRITNFYKRVK